MNADDYNWNELTAGRITKEMITELVSFYQFQHDLPADGMLGPKTRAHMAAALGPAPAPISLPFLDWPMPVLHRGMGLIGRKPVITSAFRTKDRPNHNGIDLFYAYEKGDSPDFVGDKGGAGKQPDGTPRWVVPYGVHALAAADGVIQIAGNSKTGYRCWVDHSNGWRTGYFHLLDLKVSVGQKVVSGQPLGLIGDNPADHDGRHLHFELSPTDRYAPVNPEAWMKK